MTGTNDWLANLGMPALPVVSNPTLPPSRAPVPVRSATTSRTATSTSRALPLERLDDMPVPNAPLVACQAIVASEHENPWKAMSDPHMRILGLAFALVDGAQVRLGLWTPEPVTAILPSSLGLVERWHGTSLPPPVAQMLAQGTSVIAHQFVLAQAVFATQGWVMPRWVSPEVMLAEVNRGAGLDEIAAWLVGAPPTPLTKPGGEIPVPAKGVAKPTKDAIEGWNGLRNWSGVVIGADLGQDLVPALVAARISLGVGARLGTAFPTELEERGWFLDQAVNLNGVPFDRAAIDAVVELAQARLPLIKGLAPAANKLREIVEHACLDDVVRGSYGYCAQLHGRWTSSKPAMQNACKPTWKPAQLRAVWRALKSGRLMRCLKHIPVPVLERLVANMERGVFVAPEGYVFVVADQTAAEPRRVFQVAGRQDVLAVMQAGDLYVDPTLQRMLFGDSVPKGHPDWDRRRLILKVMVIACGYGMSADTLNDYARDSWNLDLVVNGVQPEAVIGTYRRMFRQVPRLWYSLQDASLAALRGEASVETPVGVFRRSGSDLLLVLPSGRPIVYPEALIVRGNYGDPVLGYRHGGPLSGQCSTAWGGTLLCHATCGTLRDIHVHHLVTLAAEGWLVVAHTHDEAVLMVPAGLADRAVARMKEVMCAAPSWVGALPLLVKPFCTERLGKKGLIR